MIYQRGAVWWVKLKWQGQVIRKSSGETSRSKAESFERLLIKKLSLESLKIEHGMKEPEKAEGASVLFSEAWERYMAEEAPLKAKGTHDRAIQAAKRFLPVMGGLALTEITPKVLNKYKVKRITDGVCLATVAKELRFVQRVFSLCKGEWELIKQTPFDGFEIPAANKERVSYLQPGQLEKLLAASPEWLRPIILLAMHTGIRRGNLADLEWEQVDMEQRTLILYDTKNGHPVTIPLGETACNILKDLRRSNKGGKYVFPHSTKQEMPKLITRAFTRARNKAGLKKFRFHDLRHDFATRLVKSRVDLYRVGKLLAHNDVRMTKRYAHLDVEDLRSAVGVLDGRDSVKLVL